MSHESVITSMCCFDLIVHFQKDSTAADLLEFLNGLAKLLPPGSAGSMGLNR